MNNVAIVGALTVKIVRCEMGMLSEMLYALKVPPLIVAYRTYSRYTMLYTHTPKVRWHYSTNLAHRSLSSSYSELSFAAWDQ